MASDLDNLAEELKEKHGLDFASLLRDTHTETATQVASLVGETLELALRAKLLVEKKPVNDQMFERNGTMATLQKRIDAAHVLKLIDDVTRKDAHLVLHIRNKFAHPKGKLDFDSRKTAALAKQLSTYEAATSYQDAFLKAAENVVEKAANAVKALRKEPEQAEPKSPEP